MISKQLLTRKGSIEALLALQTDSELTTSELAEQMDVANGTARDRMGDLEDEGLVEKDAALRGEDPVRVYQVTDDGATLATSLQSILDERGEPSGADPDGTVDVASDEEETVEADSD